MLAKFGGREVSLLLGKNPYILTWNFLDRNYDFKVKEVKLQKLKLDFQTL